MSTPASAAHPSSHALPPLTRTHSFHPAAQKAKAILDSGELGAVQSTEIHFELPPGLIGDPNDIRFKYALGGGVMMDVGCYAMNILRFLTGAEPTAVLAAAHEPPPFPADANIDHRSTAALAFPRDVTGSLSVAFARRKIWGFIPPLPNIRAIVRCAGGELELVNFVFPTVWHYIQVRPKVGAQRTEKAYTYKEAGMEGKGEDWWLTYRYQLEAFVDALKGRKPAHWISKEDSISNLTWIEEVYKKVRNQAHYDFA